MNDHGKTTAAFESIAAGLGRGLIYIQEDYNIGAYSNLAKEITGIRLPAHSQGHDGGNIEEGDIVVIADNDLGNDDGLSPEDLKLINIYDSKIKCGDALLAIGVYKNRKIKFRLQGGPQLQNLKQNYGAEPQISGVWNFGAYR